MYKCVMLWCVHKCVCVCQHVCVPGVHMQRSNYERMCFNRVVLQVENVEISCTVIDVSSTSHRMVCGRVHMARAVIVCPVVFLTFVLLVFCSLLVFYKCCCLL